jgi:hypothetical protein
MVHSDRPGRLCHRHFLPVHRHHVEQDKIDSYTQLSSPMRSPFTSAAGVGATRPAAVTLAVAVGHGAVWCTAATPGFDVFAASDTPAITSAASGSAHDQLSNPLSTKPTSRIADRYATLTRHEPVTASMRVTRPSAVSTGLPRAMSVRALPAASATITRKVSAVQMMPSIDGAGRPPVAKV